MRIVLQQVASGKFLTAEGLWTEHTWEAKTFDHFLDALVYARDNVEEPVGAYCLFPEPGYNFSVYLRDATSAAQWDAKVKPLRDQEALRAQPHTV